MMRSRKSEIDKTGEIQSAEAWTRFERAVDAAVKSGPMHKTALATKPIARPASKGRGHKGKTRN